MPRIVFRPGARGIEVPRGALLIDAVRAAGLPIARACGDDLICGRCGVRILAGRVRPAGSVEREALRRNRVPAEMRLACAVRVHDDLEVTTDYWGAVEP